MYGVNLALEILLFIIYLIIVSRASDKYNIILKEAKGILGKQSLDRDLALNNIAIKIKSLRKKGFLNIISIFVIVTFLILIITIITEMSYYKVLSEDKLNDRFIKRLIFDLVPFLIACGAQLLFFLFVHYVILYVLKGRGTIDARPAKNQQFPFPW
jgi:hypothetical protein